MEELKLKIKEISERIKELREIENVSVAEMARLTGVCCLFSIMKLRRISISSLVIVGDSDNILA